MNGKPLTETNPYLKDPKKRKTLLLISVSTSTAIEGVHIKPSEIQKSVKIKISTPKP
jgi:hypothetical protein